jgi:alkylation response protein AidB-like acyl-CoA dehydrogenase
MQETDLVGAARSDLESWQREAAAALERLDPFAERLLRRLLGDAWPAARPRLEAVARQAGERLDALVREANRDANLPELRRHDALGRRTEEVVFHPAHHEAGRVFWGSGVLAALAAPGSEVLAGAIAYLLDRHGEAGHACPVACTAGAVKLLQRLGTAEQRERYLPGLLSADYERRLHAAQFVTEVQGGSDVGANDCRAVPEAGRPRSYRISGEKWFCSVADAGLFVVSARLPGAAAGTGGLGLFLVPRLVDGEVNGFALRRLKYKLGTRSMPTGEIEFEGALGELIGPPEAGFKNLVGIVLDTSRVHNALAACGLMRRCLSEGHTFSRSRRAFSRAIADYPAVQEILARMKLATMAAMASTFRVLAMSDRLDRGEGGAELAAARRIAVMVNKYWTARAATDAARDGIELLGGNGTIEDFSVLPRLYRDAIVIESWEGTHNTLCAQVLRDFAARSLHRPWLAELQREVEALAHPGTREVAAIARGLLADLESRVARLLAGDELAAAACIRPVVDRMCRVTDWVALATQLDWELARGEAGDTAEALELYRMTRLEAADPQATPRLAELNRGFAAAI